MDNNLCMACGEPLVKKEETCPHCGESINYMKDKFQPSKQIKMQHDPVPKKPNIHKWIYTSIIVIIAVFAYVFFIKSNPEEVAEQFSESMVSYDMETAQQHLSNAADEYLVNEIEWMTEDAKEHPESVEKLKGLGYILEDFVIYDEHKTSQSAIIYGDILMQNSKLDYSVSIKLVKESGQWKVTDFKEE